MENLKRVCPEDKGNKPQRKGEESSNEDSDMPLAPFTLTPPGGGRGRK
jgi:hypothetical protein